MTDRDNKARELKSFMKAAGIVSAECIKRVLESQIRYIDDYSLTDDEKKLFRDAAALIIAENDTEWTVEMSESFAHWYNRTK